MSQRATTMLVFALVAVLAAIALVLAHTRGISFPLVPKP